jgi:hypothetical protein
MVSNRTERAVCQSCKDQPAEIFQEDGDYCLECWQKQAINKAVLFVMDTLVTTMSKATLVLFVVHFWCKLKCDKFQTPVIICDIS